MKTMLKLLAGAIVLLFAQATMASMAAGLPARFDPARDALEADRDKFLAFLRQHRGR